MKKESIFTKEGVFGCDVFQSSVLEVAKKYIFAKSSFCGSGNTAFSQKKFWSSSGRKKQVDFSQRLGKTSRFFFRYLQKQVGVFKWQGETFFIIFLFQLCRSCSPSSLIRHSQSSRWFFSVVLLEDVIVEDWGGFTNSSFFLGRTREPLLWPNSNHWSGENAGAEATFFVFRLGCCSGALTF